MSFRFRKQLGIPGVKLNLTKHGISSLSVGKTGSKMNLSSSGLKLTAGIPGSGLSYSTTLNPAANIESICPKCGGKKSKKQEVCSNCKKELAEALKPKCDTCGKVIRKGTKFCSNCGQPIPPEKYQPVKRRPKCNACGKAIRKDAQFCTNCGHPVQDDINDKNIEVVIDKMDEDVEVAIDEILEELDQK